MKDPHPCPPPPTPTPPATLAPDAIGEAASSSTSSSPESTAARWALGRIAELEDARKAADAARADHDRTIADLRARLDQLQRLVGGNQCLDCAD